MDADGNWNRQQKTAVTVKVEGAARLQGYGNADPSCEGSYQDSTWETYDGTVMAVIRAAREPGEAKIVISADHCADEVVTLQIV